MDIVRRSCTSAKILQFGNKVEGCGLRRFRQYRGTVTDPVGVKTLPTLNLNTARASSLRHIAIK